MSTPLRQTIMAAYEDQLQLILVASGYNTGLGAYIYEWRETPWTDGETLGLIYRDTQDTTAQTIGQQEHILTVENEILVVGSATTMRQVIADVTTALGANKTLGGYAEDIRPIADETIEAEHYGKRAFIIKMMVQIEYISGNWNAYGTT